MTDFDMPDKVSSMKYSLKLVPGIGVSHRDGDDTRTPPKCLEG